MHIHDKLFHILESKQEYNFIGSLMKEFFLLTTFTELILVIKL